MGTPVDSVPNWLPPPLDPPGGAHGKVAVKPLSISDVVFVCHFDAPAKIEAPSTNGSTIRGEVKDLVYSYKEPDRVLLLIAVDGAVMQMGLDLFVPCPSHPNLLLALLACTTVLLFKTLRGVESSLIDLMQELLALVDCGSACVCWR
ncbi:hypothetical protein Nepgr_015897 [Nepenthes gracilis]|uniref:Uncharacterized protein n=1 Tax=Nepenthes gracilis TaxID=150966 RepID=A0AAD3XRQ9_NEPGR|nr:hypothetical protein Nepgr_015897 [Nepenthes gracilis]